MVQRTFWDRLLWAINVVLAIALLIAMVCPYVSVSTFPPLAVLSLLVPFLVATNLLCMGYWAMRWRKWFWADFGLLLLGYLVMGTFYEYGSPKIYAGTDGIKVFSFNTRGFNRLGIIRDEKIGEKIVQLVKDQDPDIVCFQEFDYTKSNGDFFSQYPYKYVDFIYGNYSRHKVIQAIYSKYPIVGKGSLEFPETANNGIYADLLYQKDTIRVYNLHLQSLKIIPSVRRVAREDKGRLYNRAVGSFEKQEEQARLFLKSRQSVPYKTIVCGDFNNNQYSHTYHLIKGDMQDTFAEQGSGFGKTHDFLGYPLRIDFILADPDFEVLAHQNFTQELSDHYPIAARLRLSH